MQQQQQQQGFPMVQVMQPNMQGMMGMNFGGQMPPGAMPMQVGLCLCTLLCFMWFLFLGASTHYRADPNHRLGCSPFTLSRLDQFQQLVRQMVDVLATIAQYSSAWFGFFVVIRALLLWYTLCSLSPHWVLGPLRIKDRQKK